MVLPDLFYLQFTVVLKEEIRTLIFLALTYHRYACFKMLMV